MVSIHDLEQVLADHESSVPGRSLWDLFLNRIWSLNCLDALEVFFTSISSLLPRTREEQLYYRDHGTEPPPEPEHTGGAKMRISRSSPLGLFVRRAQLEFTRLQFHDTVKLWKSFVKYRVSTYRAWARKNPSPSDEQGAIDANLIEIGEGSSGLLTPVVYGNMDDNDDDLECEQFISTKDMERLLEFQVDELQSEFLLLIPI